MALAISSNLSVGEPKLEALAGGFIPLLTLFERLSVLGYTFDLAKWERLVESGLLRGVPAIPSSDCQVPLAIEARLRIILDTERRLQSEPSIDKLAFFLVVNGLEAVPVALVIDYIQHSINKFFIAGSGMLRRLPNKPAHLGPASEHRLAADMAHAIVKEYPPSAGANMAAYQELLQAAFVLHLRCNWRNKKAGPQRRWPRIITPDYLDYQALPVKTIADSDNGDDVPQPLLEPAVDKARLLERFRREAQFNPNELAQAVKDAAIIILTAAPEFPEVGTGPTTLSRKAAFAAWVLSLVIPLLAAALFRVTLSTHGEKYGNLIPSRRETGLESILRTVLLHWHT